MIEYATRMDDFFKNETLELLPALGYYVNQFLKRLDFILPMALLLSTLKVLTSLNTQNEWTVFQVAGLSTRKLLSPFFAISLLCSTFLWINFEYLLPPALQNIDEFRMSHSHGSHLVKRREKIHLIPLKDQSKLLYQSYNAEKHALFDVLWIKSGDEIWRMKYLSADPAHPKADFVDHLVRSPNGMMEKQASYDSLILTDLKWHPRYARKALVSFDQKSISELASLIKNQKVSPYDMPKVKTALAFKITLPLLSPLIVLSFAPACLTFSRHRSFFLTYAIAIFSFFALYMLLDSLSILSDNALVSPIYTVLLPIFSLFVIFGWKFRKKTA
jgi:lipopolysaccharide export system permease protein